MPKFPSTFEYPLETLREVKLEKQRFIDYLEKILIPDLLKAGMQGTAHDFKLAVAFLKV